MNRLRGLQQQLEVAVFSIQNDYGSGRNLALRHQFCYRLNEVPLDGSFEFSRPELQARSRFEQQIAGRNCALQPERFTCKSSLN